MMVRDWSVLFANQAPEGADDLLDEDDHRVDDLLDVLADFAPVAVSGGPRWSVAITLEAAAPHDALGMAGQLVEEAAMKVGLPRWPIVRAEAVRDDEQERELREPNFPAVIGTAEVTELLGVSRQRLYELRTAGRFPEPMTELAAGPVWLRSTVDSFLENWNRKPGRPRGRTNEQCARAAECIPTGSEWATFRMAFNVHCKKGRTWEEAVELATAQARQTDPDFEAVGIDWEGLAAI